MADNKIEDPVGIDDDGADDDDPHYQESNIHHIRRRFAAGSTNGTRASIRLIENGAFAMSSTRDASSSSVLLSSRRSLGGRLGGAIESIRALDLDQVDEQQEEVVDETTGLVTKVPAPSIISGPPLTKWIVPALFCAASYSLYNIYIKKGSYSIQPIIGGVILQLVAAMIGTILLAVIVISDPAAKDAIHYDKTGIFWSIMAGLAVSCAELLSFCVSGMGVAATQSIPIIIGGSVMFGSVFGLLMLGEKMMLHGWSGVGLLVLGIALVATDKGEKMEEGGPADDENDDSAPPMLIWIGPALICACAYALYNINIKKSSANINPILGGCILQYVAALFGMMLLGALIIIVGEDIVWFDGNGILMSMIAGVFVGTAELLSFMVSGMGVQATQSIPIIIGGSVMFGAVAGIFMLGETLLLQGWIGVALLMIGIGLVATDPGEKVAGH